MKRRFVNTLLSLLGTVLILAADAQPPLKEVNHFTVNHFANYLHFSKDGKTLILAVGFDANVYEKGQNGFQLKQILQGYGGQCMHPGISPDGTYVAISNAEKTVVYKKSPHYNLLQTIQHAGGYDYELDIHFTSNQQFFTINKDGFIRFYELSGGQFIEMTKVINPSGGRFESATVSPDGRMISTVDAEGKVRCWKVNGNYAEPGKEVMKINRYMGKITMSNDGLLAVADEKKLQLFTIPADLQTATLVQTISDMDCSAIQFSPDGRRLMASTRNGNVAIYQVSKSGISLEISNAANNLFHALEISPDGRWMAASNQDQKLLKIYEVRAPLKNTKTPVASNSSGNNTVVKTAKGKKTTQIDTAADNESTTKATIKMNVSENMSVTATSQELSFELREDFSRNMTGNWIDYFEDDDDGYSPRVTFADGLLLLQNNTGFEGSVSLPIFDKNRRVISDHKDATHLYSAGFLYLEGRGRLGWKVTTEARPVKKYASYICTIDHKGVASLIFRDTAYNDIIVKKTQLKNFKPGNPYVLTTIFDKNNISFYINKNLIAAEKFRGFTLAYTSIVMDDGISAALTNADILAYYGGDKNFQLTQIERAIAMANTNYLQVKSSGQLTKHGVSPEEPTAKVETEEYSFSTFPSLVKNGRLAIVGNADSDQKKQQLKNIPALNTIEPYEVRISVDTVHVSSAQALVAKRTNWWAESQIPFDTKRTPAEVAKSRSKLKTVNEQLIVNGKKATAVYVMREIAQYGSAYEAMLILPTKEPKVFVEFYITVVGENFTENTNGYLLSSDDFAIMNGQIRKMFSSFIYKNHR